MNSRQVSDRRREVRSVGTDATFSLPDFPTLLSAEGEFLIIARSISQDAQHIYGSNAGQKKRGQKGRRRGEGQSIRRGKPGKTEQAKGETHFDAPEQGQIKLLNTIFKHTDT